MSPIERDFAEWSKIRHDKLDSALAIVLRIAFEAGHEHGIRFANAQLEDERAALARVGVISGDDARRLEEAMERNNLRAGIRSGSTGDAP
jgi:hypothetical protein